MRDYDPAEEMTRRFMKMQRPTFGGIATVVIVAQIVVWFVLVSAIGYVVVHFVRKFW